MPATGLLIEMLELNEGRIEPTMRGLSVLAQTGTEEARTALRIVHRAISRKPGAIIMKHTGKGMFEAERPALTLEALDYDGNVLGYTPVELTSLLESELSHVLGVAQDQWSHTAQIRIRNSEGTLVSSYPWWSRLIPDSKSIQIPASGRDR
jgi:hypothetical protein